MAAKRKPKLTHLEHRALEHRIGQDVEHHTRVVGNDRKMYRVVCSCGYQSGKAALQTESAKQAIHHQLLVRGERKLGDGWVKASIH